MRCATIALWVSFCLLPQHEEAVLEEEEATNRECIQVAFCGYFSWFLDERTGKELHVVPPGGFDFQIASRRGGNLEKVLSVSRMVDDISVPAAMEIRRGKTSARTRRRTVAKSTRMRVGTSAMRDHRVVGEFLPPSATRGGGFRGRGGETHRAHGDEMSRALL